MADATIYNSVQRMREHIAEPANLAAVLIEAFKRIEQLSARITELEAKICQTTDQQR